jgi:Fic family protein
MNLEIVMLLKERRKLERMLDTLVYGSVEIRTAQGAEYLYVNYRKDGRKQSKYVGKYTKELADQMVGNSMQAKKIKKQLRQIAKRLKVLEYHANTAENKVLRNIDFARRNLPEIIYKQAILEGITTTFATTEELLNNEKVKDMNMIDIIKIVNLKRAWEFVLDLDVITSPLTLDLICEVNKLVERDFSYFAGRIRDTPVRIRGTTYVPPLPIKTVILEELSDILNAPCDLSEKAINLLLYIMKKQIFSDGNKRTAVICANHLLISNGVGIITIPSELVSEFRVLLVGEYEGRDKGEIVQFLKEKCYEAI